MLSGLDRPTMLGWSRRIDAANFSSLAVGERIAFPNWEITTALAAAAAVTERVRIVATVYVLPMHATAQLAKQAATLDILSSGRLTLGVGVGGREEDYRAVGAPFARRHARMDEQVAALKRLFRGEVLTQGAAPVGPMPRQPGGPPLWIAASGLRPIRRAAKWADGLAGFSLGPDPAEVEAVFVRSREAWAAAGRPRPPHLVMSFWYALGSDPADQLDRYARRYLGVFGAEPAEALARRCHCAGEAALRDALRCCEEAGADEVILVPTSHHFDELERTIDVVS
jgi:alkanesulfonate monooxygenase SsuD/methylene tetrahydromethanopterin reductase-like flavin-dependent oxidoreductase (luciferase family)